MNRLNKLILLLLLSATTTFGQRMPPSLVSWPTNRKFNRRHNLILLFIFFAITSFAQTFQDFVARFPTVTKPAEYSIYYLNDKCKQVDTKDFIKFLLDRFKAPNNLHMPEYSYILLNDIDSDVTDDRFYYASFKYYNKIKLNDNLRGLVFLKKEVGYEFGGISFEMFVIDQTDSITQDVFLANLNCNPMDGCSNSSSEISRNQVTTYFWPSGFYKDYSLQNKNICTIENDSLKLLAENIKLTNYGAFIDTLSKEALIFTLTPKPDIFYKNSNNKIFRTRIISSTNDEFKIEFSGEIFVLKYSPGNQVWSCIDKNKKIQYFKKIDSSKRQESLNAIWLTYFDPSNIK